MTNDERISQELQTLESAYRQVFPHAQELERFSFGPEFLIEILREANGREIVFSYPLQALHPGASDGCAYEFKDKKTKRNPITLQELLYTRGLPQKRVKLVRHRDTSGNIDLYDQYRNQRPTFLEYQRQQGNPVFHNCDYVVSCLGEKGSRARFIGVYQVQGIDYETEAHFYDNLTEVSGFDDLKERVIIDWGKAAINWHQWLRQEVPKTVLEIQPRPFSESFKPFKDYLDFTLDFAELQQLVERQTPQDEWWRMLSAVAGVYMILDKSTGQQYIGSAYGTGRWS